MNSKREITAWDQSQYPGEHLSHHTKGPSLSETDPRAGISQSELPLKLGIISNHIHIKININNCRLPLRNIVIISKNSGF